MPRMSKKRRLEWSFFLRQVKVGNTTCDRITYNDLCRGCTHSCKQSFRAVIILCPRYYSKRRKKDQGLHCLFPELHKSMYHPRRSPAVPELRPIRRCNR